MNTNFDYFPLPNGVTHELDMFDVPGHVVRISTNEVMQTIPDDVYDFRVDLDTMTPHANSPQYSNFFHNNDSRLSFGFQAYKSYQTSAGEPKFRQNACIWDAPGVAWDGQQFMPYLGEIRNPMGGYMIPPEPKMTLFPRAGQILDVHSSLYSSPTNPTPDFADWRSTLYVYEHWMYGELGKIVG